MSRSLAASRIRPRVWRAGQNRGYVTSRSGPGGGIFAAAPTPIVRLGNSVLALDREAASVADAARMRDAPDPLLIEDVPWHSSATDVRDMRTPLTAMADALDAHDAVALVKANWALHARIAEVSPNALLRSVYLSLLEIVITQTLSLAPTDHAPLPDYVTKRYELAAELADAIEARDHDTATRLILEHNQMLKNTPGDPQHVSTPWPRDQLTRESDLGSRCAAGSTALVASRAHQQVVARHCRTHSRIRQPLAPAAISTVNVTDTMRKGCPGKRRLNMPFHHP